MTFLYAAVFLEARRTACLSHHRREANRTRIADQTGRSAMMLTTMATLRGELSPWPTRDELVRALRDGGLSVLEGRCCVVVKDCEYFVFERYSPVCGPYLCADANDAEALVDDARRVSRALAQHGIRHRFTVLGHEGALVEYLHHDWPFPDTARKSALSGSCGGEEGRMSPKP